MYILHTASDASPYMPMQYILFRVDCGKNMSDIIFINILLTNEKEIKRKTVFIVTYYSNMVFDLSIKYSTSVGNDQFERLFCPDKQWYKIGT